jgi:type I restriction enzyme S subunit
MELKPRYKQTEVGTIPENWNVVAVRQMGEVVTGKALAVNALGTRRPYLRTKNVFDGRIDIDDVLTMPMTDEQFAHFQIRRGDVLLNEGQSLELVGRCSLYLDEYPEPCAMQNQLLRFRAHKGVCPVFASYLFRYCQQTGVFARIASQTTSIAHLGGSRFEQLRLAWPHTEDEQRTIAEVLTDVDGLLGRLDRLIAKKRDLKQAAMQQLLTGQTRLPGFHDEWEAKRLEEIAEVKTGPFGSTLHESDYVQDGTPIITVEHLGEFGIEHFNLPLVSDSDLHRLRTYLLETGDIVFSRVGSVDRNALVRPSESGWLFSGRLLRIRPNKQKVFPPFLSYQFHSELFKVSVRNVAVGQTMASLNTQILKGLLVTLPCFLEQTAIAFVLMDMDTELVALGQRREKTQALKQAMMQELLTGKTRLLKPEAVHA